MAIPINIEQLLSGRIVEWERLDFKKGWNPEDVLHTMTAFANDIHNWGGGYIVVGVEEHDGMPILPPCGIDIKALDGIQKELVQLCNMVQPVVNVLTEPVEYKGVSLLIIWVPGGELRPYKAPAHIGREYQKQGKLYYVRQGSVTRIANPEEEQTLMRLCNKVPFDDRICQQASLDDFDMIYIRDFLRKTGSGISDNDVMTMPRELLFQSMQIVGGTSEYLKPKNVGLLFFSDKAEEYMPYARIEIVRFLDDVGDRFEEKILHGPIHLQLKEALDYLKYQVVMEKVTKVPYQAEAIRVFNYPYAALEEIMCNAVYHKSWDDRNPIEVRINPDNIEVFNIEGPMPPLTKKDFLKERIASRNYRNRRIGDFLKELHLTEGRSTGLPKIRQALRNNGSPEAVFETDEQNSYFLAHLDIHPAFKEIKTESSDYKAEGKKELTERQRVILQLLTEDNTLSAKAISEKISEKTSEKTSEKLNVSDRTIETDLARLKSDGYIVREGGRKDGHWVILVTDH